MVQAHTLDDQELTRRRVLQNDGYWFLRAILDGRPYFGPRFASSQGEVGRHAYMAATVAMLAEAGCRRINILEAGSWAGGSAITWAKALDAHGLGGRVYCIDHWQQVFDLSVNSHPVYSEMVRAVKGRVIERLFHHNVSAAGVADRIVVLRGSTHDLLPSMAPASFDIVFIDASHLYQDVVPDLQAAVTLVRDGGILCGDDLELQLGDCDEGALRASIRANADYDADPRTGVHYHPGVTAAVAEVLGRVGAWKGFWAMQRNGARWTPPDLPAERHGAPEHLTPAAAQTRVDLHREDGFVILDTNEGAVALAARLTPEDLLTIPRETWSTAHLAIAGHDLAEIRAGIAASRLVAADGEPPVLVVTGYSGYNVVRWGRRFFAVSQALGALDLAALDGPSLAALRASRDVLVSDEQDEALRLVDSLDVDRWRRLDAEREGQIESVTAELAEARRTLEALGIEREEHRREVEAAHAVTTAENDVAFERLSAEAAEMAAWIGELQRRLVEAGRRKPLWLRAISRSRIRLALFVSLATGNLSR